MGLNHEIDRYKDVSNLAARSRGMIGLIVGHHLSGFFEEGRGHETFRFDEPYTLSPETAATKVEIYEGIVDDVDAERQSLPLAGISVSAETRSRQGLVVASIDNAGTASYNKHTYPIKNAPLPGLTWGRLRSGLYEVVGTNAVTALTIARGVDGAAARALINREHTSQINELIDEWRQKVPEGYAIHEGVPVFLRDGN